MITTNIKVDGMSCQHCVKTIEGALASEKGVTRVKVSLENKTVSITFDSSLHSIEDLKRMIEEKGYEIL